MTKQIIIVGAGSFGREVLSWHRSAAPSTPIAGFLDDEGGTSGGLPCLGTTLNHQPTESQEFLVAIADPQGRSKVVSRLRERGASFASFIHPTAILAEGVQIGEGCILCPLSLVSVGASVGEFVIVNVHSSVGHDVRVGAYSTLSSHVDLTGGVSLGERVSVGSSACVLPEVAVGDDSVIGAGSVVVRDMPSGSTVYSQPAKRLR
jgi:sugar O-acyltransferase (sialic acid O-acetyltransferase NeuD family)